MRPDAELLDRLREWGFGVEGDALGNHTVRRGDTLVAIAAADHLSIYADDCIVLTQTPISPQSAEVFFYADGRIEVRF